MKIAYFGSGAFAVAPLDALAAAPDIEVVAVVSRPDKPVGRAKQLAATPVAEAARRLGLPLLQPSSLKDEAVLKELADLKADFFVVASYGRIIPQAILDLPRLGSLNLHGSILPEYRGASPIQAAIAAGDRETGVTLMKMDAEVDHGPVYASVTVPITAADTHDTLELNLGAAAATLLIEHLSKIADGALAPTEQDHDAATFTQIVDKEDGLIRWTEETAEEIERKRRAYTPWPGIYSVIPAKAGIQAPPKRLKLLDVAIDHHAPADLAPGTAYLTTDDLPAVRAKEDGVVLRKVQPEGKAAMEGRAFLNGHKGFAGTILTA